MEEESQQESSDAFERVALTSSAGLWRRTALLLLLIAVIFVVAVAILVKLL